jgi:group I intron endonuclease
VRNFVLIYLVRNRVNEKCYVGQTTATLEKRWRRHVSNSKTCQNMPIASAIRKYGSDSFEVSVLETCESQEALNEREIFWARHLCTFSPRGYNLRAGAGAGAMSQELKDRISKSLMGRRVTDETRRRLSVSHLGKRMNEETKQKLSRHWKGKKPSELAQQRSSESCQKTYDVTSPDGVTTRIVNMRKFCHDNTLSHTKMSSVVHGRIASHKGWRAIEVSSSHGSAAGAAGSEKPEQLG